MAYAPITGAALYGFQGGQPAAYGIAVPSNVVAFPGSGARLTDPQGPGTPGDGALVAVPRDFFRSSGFGLILLVLLVLYFDLRLLNR